MKLTVTPPPEVLSESEEEQQFLIELAEEFIGMLEDTERAMAKKIEAQMFDIDEYVAFWSLLPAKVRTAIKRGGASAGTACPECHQVAAHSRNCSVGGRFA